MTAYEVRKESFIPTYEKVMKQILNAYKKGFKYSILINYDFSPDKDEELLISKLIDEGYDLTLTKVKQHENGIIKFLQISWGKAEEGKKGTLETKDIDNTNGYYTDSVIFFMTRVKEDAIYA